MSVAECVGTIQTTSAESESGGSPATSEYLVFAMVALILGLVVVMFIRTSVRRSAKGGNSQPTAPRQT